MQTLDVLSDKVTQIDTAMTEVDVGVGIIATRIFRDGKFLAFDLHEESGAGAI